MITFSKTKILNTGHSKKHGEVQPYARPPLGALEGFGRSSLQELLVVDLVEGQGDGTARWALLPVHDAVLYGVLYHLESTAGSP